MARNRYLLFKAPGKWTDSQKRRAGILFKQFPDIKAVCYYALRLGKIFTDYIDKDVACAKNLEVGVKNRTFKWKCAVSKYFLVVLHNNEIEK